MTRALFLGLLAVGQLFWPANSFAADLPQTFPDVTHLPVRAAMPNPLILDNGQTITTARQWEKHREEMKSIIEYYAVGHAPLPPGNVKGDDLEFRMLANGAVIYRRVHLAFGPGEKLGLNISVFIPAATNGFSAPFPTIVQPSFFAISDNPPPAAKMAAHAKRPPSYHETITPEAAAAQYAQALDRGYAVVSFFYQECGQDGGDYRQTGFFPGYADDTNYDWADLSAWAWGMSRCVDYLETEKFADRSKIIGVGHSRLGKATLLAGAFDERFALVAPCGSGCGGTGAYRFNGKSHGGREGLEDIVKHFPQWTIPRLAEFSNRVDRLPFDQHWLIDLVAPRCFIACDGLSDPNTSINALDQSYLAAQPAYALLGVPDHLGINFRPGVHLLAPDDWTAILDFSDQQLRHLNVKRRFDQLPPPQSSQ
ncbi:MAG TPA: hypothetical protein VGI03_01895 [Verrucomicrobiae bacterium]|jgi:hypothetical protein